ncbi:MAG TPA: hypothetical protein VMI54_04190 [Polyangiaceae bacterium]|nr:hypothetical protein [Polyangiaceae bacterium]
MKAENKRTTRKSSNTPRIRAKREEPAPAPIDLGERPYARQLATTLLSAGETSASVATKLRHEADLLEAEADSLSKPRMIGPDERAKRVVAFMKDRLVRATDVTSEAVAALDGVVEHNEESTNRSVAEHLHEVHSMLWEMRWECFADVDDVKKKTVGGAS